MHGAISGLFGGIKVNLYRFSLHEGESGRWNCGRDMFSNPGANIACSHACFIYALLLATVEIDEIMKD